MGAPRVTIEFPLAVTTSPDIPVPVPVPPVNTIDLTEITIDPMHVLALLVTAPVPVREANVIAATVPAPDPARILVLVLAPVTVIAITARDPALLVTVVIAIAQDLARLAVLALLVIVVIVTTARDLALVVALPAIIATPVSILQGIVTGANDQPKNMKVRLRFLEFTRTSPVNMDLGMKVRFMSLHRRAAVLLPVYLSATDLAIVRLPLYQGIGRPLQVMQTLFCKSWY